LDTDMTIKILLIDDDPDLLDLMAAAFARADFEVFTAKDGIVGARLFRAHGPELVVTDIVMPEREGIETIVELKRAANPPKVIAISGAGMMAGHDFLQWATMLGADEILLKPFQMSALVALARRVLGLGEEPSAADARLGLPQRDGPHARPS
jgi:DNA-binding response OmpR family regulator